LADDAGQAGRLRALGAVELPGDRHGALDQGLLDVVAGLEVGDPGVEPALVLLGVLAGEDEELGLEAVLEGIEPRVGLALGGLGPLTLLTVLAADGGSLGRGERHVVGSPVWMDAVEGHPGRSADHRTGRGASPGADLTQNDLPDAIASCIKIRKSDR